MPATKLLLDGVIVSLLYLFVKDLDNKSCVLSSRSLIQLLNKNYPRVEHPSERKAIPACRDRAGPGRDHRFFSRLRACEEFPIHRAIRARLSPTSASSSPDRALSFVPSLLKKNFPI